MHSSDLFREIIGHKHVQLKNQSLQKAIKARTEYMDPLTLIQIHALQRYRKSKDLTDRSIVLLTINGIAAGMKNTG